MFTQRFYHQPHCKAGRDPQNLKLISIREVATYADQDKSMQTYWNDALKSTNRYFMKLKTPSGAVTARIITKNKATCFDIRSSDDMEQHLGLSNLSLKDLGILHFGSDQSVDSHITVLAVFYDQLLYGHTIDSDTEGIRDELLAYLYSKNIEVEPRSIRNRIKFLTDIQTSAIVSEAIAKLSYFDKIKKQPKPAQRQLIKQRYPPIAVESVSEIPPEYPYFAIGGCLLRVTEAVVAPKHSQQFEHCHDNDQQPTISRKMLHAQKNNKNSYRCGHKNRENVRKDLAFSIRGV